MVMGIIVDMGSGEWTFDESTKLFDQDNRPLALADVIARVLRGDLTWIVVEGQATNVDPDEEVEPWQQEEVHVKRAVSLLNVSRIASLSVVYD